MWGLPGEFLAAVVTALVGLALALGQLVGRRSKQRRVTNFLLAEVHNYARHNAANLRAALRLLRKSDGTVSEFLSALKKAQFVPAAKDPADLFLVRNLDHMSVLPLQTARELLRLQIIARNTEIEIEAFLHKYKRKRVVDSGLVSDFEVIAGYFERGALEGQRLTDRMSERSWDRVSRSIPAGLRGLFAWRWLQDRPIVDANNRVFEEAEAWLWHSRRSRQEVGDELRSFVAESLSIEGASPIPTSEVVLTESVRGTFNDVWKVRVGGQDYALRQMSRMDDFRYETSVVKAAVLQDLYARHSHYPPSEPCDDLLVVTVEDYRDAPMRAARGRDLRWPGPKIYASSTTPPTSTGSTKTKDCPRMISEWVDVPVDSKIDYLKLGGLVSEVHGLTFKWYFRNFLTAPVSKNEYVERTIYEIAERARAAEFEIKSVRELVARCRGEFEKDVDRDHLVLCHNDIHPENVFTRKDGTIGLLDWDNAVVAHHLLDFVKPLYWNSYDRSGVYCSSPERFTQFLRGYYQGDDDKVAAVHHSKTFLLLRLLWLLRVMSFERSREEKGLFVSAPFPGSRHYERLIHRIISGNWKV